MKKSELISLIESVVKKQLNEATIPFDINALKQYKQKIQNNADKLFREGKPVTTFFRTLASDIEAISQLNIFSENYDYVFYTPITHKNHIDVKRMTKILKWLGYGWDVFGLHRLNKVNEAIDVNNNKILYLVKFKPGYTDKTDTTPKPVFIYMSKPERTKIAMYAAVDNITGFGDKKITPTMLTMNKAVEMNFTEVKNLVHDLLKVKIQKYNN